MEKLRQVVSSMERSCCRYRYLLVDFSSFMKFVTSCPPELLSIFNRRLYSILVYRKKLFLVRKTCKNRETFANSARSVCCRHVEEKVRGAPFWICSLLSLPYVLFLNQTIMLIYPNIGIDLPTPPVDSRPTPRP